MTTTYRFRETSDTYERAVRRGLTLDQAIELARASTCPIVERLGHDCRWEQVAVRVAIREQGQRFATYASLLVGGKCVATTGDVPFGFSARAHELAEHEAIRLGMVVAT